MWITEPEVLQIDVLGLYRAYNSALLESFKIYLTTYSDSSILAGNILKIVKELESVHGIGYLAVTSDPFMLYYIYQLIVSSQKVVNERYLQLIFFHLIDCYFSSIKKLQLSIKFKERFNYLLPNNNINLPIIGQNLIFTKKGFCVLEVLRASHLKVVNQQNLYNFVPGIKVVTNFVTNDNLFLQEMAEVLDLKELNIRADIQDYTIKLSSALDIIKEVNGQLFAEINRLIKFIMPLSLTNKQKKQSIRMSFSSRNFIGVIFASACEDEFLFAEDIIHEYSHNVLFVVSKVFPIINEDDKCCYYSPWREDPRPLYGLIHALFTFTNVANFWYECLQNKKFSSKSNLIEFNLIRCIYRLKLGFQQVPLLKLTSHGQKLYSLLQGSYNEIVTKSCKIIQLCCPDYIEQHALDWQKRNPMERFVYEI
jgi:hypothetical protein